MHRLVDPAADGNEWLAIIKKPFHHIKEPSEVPKAMAELQKQLAVVDCVIACTPEYNHAPAPAMLAVLDNFYHETWGGKPAGIVHYGGQSAAGGRASYVLRNTMAELRMIVNATTFSVSGPWSVFTEEGKLTEGNEGKQKFMDDFIESLEKLAKQVNEKK